MTRQMDAAARCGSPAAATIDVHRLSTRAERAPQVPLLIGAANAVHVTGQSWPAVRRSARELGIRELRVSQRRVVIDASAYLAALRERAEREQPSDDDVRAELVRRLG